MTIQTPYSKICGACSKNKNLQDFNRVTSDQRFFNRICKSCEELNSRKMKPQMVATLDVPRVY